MSASKNNAYQPLSLLSNKEFEERFPREGDKWDNWGGTGEQEKYDDGKHMFRQNCDGDYARNSDNPFHREGDLPAVFTKNDEPERFEWYIENGVCHREDDADGNPQPALIAFGGDNWDEKTLLYYKGGRLHNEKGPAIDSLGETVYFLDSCEFALTEEIVMRPHEQDIEGILAHDNLDVRRVALERFGWGNFIDSNHCKTLDKAPNPIEGTYELLVELEPLRGDGRRTELKETYLVGQCPSTGRMYAMQVPGEGDNGKCTTVSDARKYLASAHKQMMDGSASPLAMLGIDPDKANIIGAS